MSAGRSRLGPSVMMLFGLPFLLVGLGVAGYGIRSWLLYGQSGSWQRVPATVQDVQFVENSSGDGTTYSVKAAYQYSIGGRIYTGHRVSIIGGSSSSYGMHRRRYEQLDAARRSGKPVTALVNPRDPADAILYRETETFLLVAIPFGLVFVAAGALVIGIGIATRCRDRQLAAIVARDSNRIWDARADWAAGRVRASSVKDMLIYWGWGIGLSVFMSVFVIALAKEGAPLFAKAIVALFCLVAAFMLAKAVVLTVRLLAQGTPVLFLNEVPIVPGRPALGAVRTHRPLHGERWQVRLRCFVPATRSDSSGELKARVGHVTQQLQSATGQHRSWRTSDWRGMCAFSQDLQPAGDAKVDTEGRAMLPVSIEVPSGAPGASLEPGFSVTWTLQVKARSFPVPFNASFDLPVFYADEGEILKAKQLQPRRTRRTAKSDFTGKDLGIYPIRLPWPSS
jgi:hypothetical protein